MSDYDRVAAAIAFIQEHSKAGAAQPGLADIAKHVHLSEFHFQRLFSRWAGVSPKRYMQALTLEQAKAILRSSTGSQLAVAHELGLGGSSRVYDHFINLEAVTPEQYKTGGRGLRLAFDVQMTPYGWCFVAVSKRGICRIEFLHHENDTSALEHLQADWPEAELCRDREQAADIFDVLSGAPPRAKLPLSLWVKGTNFQLNVWRALLNIPAGTLVSYQALGESLGKASAARAIGSAVGANPVALLIPCHRVLRQTGELGGYRWGTTRKQAILVREWARCEGSEIDTHE